MSVTLAGVTSLGSEATLYGKTVARLGKMSWAIGHTFSNPSLHLDEPSNLTEYERRAAEYEQHLTEYERHRGLQRLCGSGQAALARNAKRTKRLD